MTILDLSVKIIYILTMEYEKILLNLIDRITILEEKVENLENSKFQENEAFKTSKKYRHLSAYLATSNSPSVILKFEEIEKILGFELPDSAKKHRPFWANTTTHSIALSWLSVGYETVDVNMDQQIVVFEKKD